MNKFIKDFIEFLGVLLFYLLAFVLSLLFVALVGALVKLFSTHAQ